MNWQIQQLRDWINYILFSLAGSQQPYTVPGGGGDIAYQFRHDVETRETLRIRSGYQRIAYSSFTVNGTVVVDGDLVII